MKRFAFTLFAAIGAAAAYAAYHLRRARELTLRPFNEPIVAGTGGATPPMRVLIAGDSIAAGIGATSPDRTVGGRLAAFLAETRVVEVRNEALSGSTMADIAGRTLPEERQDLIVLIGGSNDLFQFRPVERFAEETRRAMERYAERAGRLVVIGPGRVFNARAIPRPLRAVYRKQAWRYAAVMREAASRHPNAVHVDPTDPPRGILPPPNSSSADRFHPNDLGHAYWFEMVKAGLEISGLVRDVRPGTSREAEERAS